MGDETEIAIYKYLEDKKIIDVSKRIKEYPFDSDRKMMSVIVNIDNIKSIADLCQKYFEEELDETNGLPFFIYFYNKNISLMEDIKYYSKKKDWEKDEIEIIKK